MTAQRAARPAGTASPAEQPTESPAGRWLLRVGGAVFLTGLVFVALVFVPFFAGSTHQPGLTAVGALLAPAGFALVLGGLFRQARASSRAIQRAAAARR